MECAGTYLTVRQRRRGRERERERERDSAIRNRAKLDFREAVARPDSLPKKVAREEV